MDRQQRLDPLPQLVGDDPWGLLALPHGQTNAVLTADVPVRSLHLILIGTLKSSLALKDIRLAESVLDANGIDAPLARATVAAYERAVDAGYGDLDSSSYARLFRLAEPAAIDRPSRRTT
jgi:hypothetical protein